ncbi:arsenate reductase family protein [Bdellovibrio bacteriovorus]|uniref:ArsC/Spx/MgsR family protein n=1 Tax=Bdellovibrio bacteriovorus TaxID=959 RepID=UPI0021CE654B|nr:ArsC/Spx/MgsR family protein [Bdellovibrio bacteriovorus]UXR65452.1 arsenate reductase family protein [Bdellovibrio bacteriovorus]
MSSWIIYHNPKCSKSREALVLLQAQAIDAKVIEYLKEPLSESELLELQIKLGTEASALVRTKEDDYQAAPFDVTSVDLVAKKLAANPRLMERPVVVKGAVAVIGRPVENLNKLLS